MTIVVDTSVILKWFVAETGHEDAIALLQGSESRLCPDIALVETANALRRKLRLNDVSTEQMRDAIRRLPVYLKNVFPSVGLLEDACELAAKLDHSVYDCMFLALAHQQVDAVLVTADSVFLKKCVAAGFGTKVRLLGRICISDDLSADLVKDLVRLHSHYEASIDQSLRIEGIDTERDDEVRDALKPHYPLQDNAPYTALVNKFESLNASQKKIILAICSREQRLSNKISFELALFDAEELMDIYKMKIHEQIIYLKHLKDGYRDIQRSRPDLFNVTPETQNG